MVATTLGGTSLGEVSNASDRQFYFGLNRIPTVNFRIRLDNPLADNLVEGKALIKVYDRSSGVPVIHFNGPVVSSEETGSDLSATVAVSAAGPLWRLAYRLIGKTSGANATGYSYGSVLSQVDRGVIIRDIINTVNADFYTGIGVNSVQSTTQTYVAYTPYKQALEGIYELVQGVGAPDFEIVPQEPQVVALSGVSGFPKIGYMNIAPFVGTAKPNVVFEFGTGKRNVANYSRQTNLENLLNRGYSLPANDTASNTPTQPVVSSTDANSISTYGLYEGVVQTDVTTQAMRQQLVNENVRVRKTPRQIIQFQPTREDPGRPGRVPAYGIDYSVGDAVRFRAIVNGLIRVDASFRVYAVNMTLDDNGVAQPTLTLTTD
jgi:hypothetical protein